MLEEDEKRFLVTVIRGKSNQRSESYEWSEVNLVVGVKKTENRALFNHFFKIEN